MWLLEGFQYTVLQFCKYLGGTVFSTRSAISFEQRSLASVDTLLHAFFSDSTAPGSSSKCKAE